MFTLANRGLAYPPQMARALKIEPWQRVLAQVTQEFDRLTALPARDDQNFRRTSPGDFAGMDALIRVVPVDRPPVPHERSGR